MQDRFDVVDVPADGVEGLPQAVVEPLDGGFFGPRPRAGAIGPSTRSLIAIKEVSRPASSS